MATIEKAKKPAKMVHRDDKGTGRRRTIPCRCSGTMEWAKVKGKMRYVCMSCSLVCEA